MPKYPCGTCGIGVKYSGAKCTSCAKWFHAGCQNILEKNLKKWTPCEIQNWKCKDCQEKTEPNHLESNTPICHNMDELYAKLSNYSSTEEPDLNTSLSLAAEVGNTLLNENNSLKHNIQNLILENARLAAKVNQLSNINEFESQIESLKLELQQALDKNDILIQTLNEAENQLVKEKQFQNELSIVFEEQDKIKEETIQKYETQITKLQNKINKIEKGKLDTNQNLNTKIYRNAETQTNLGQLTISNTNSHTLAEITQLKLKQSTLEQAFKELENKVQTSRFMSSNTPISITAGVTPNMATQQRELAHKMRPPKHMRLDNKAKNHFSVSLQVAKTKQREKYTDEGTKSSICKTIRRPPMHAKLLIEGDTLEDFFNRETENGLALKTRAQKFQDPIKEHPTIINNTTKTSVDEHRPSHTLNDVMLSDDDDFETTDTRSPANRYIRNTAINSNSGRLSKLNEKDQVNLESIKTFSFPPEETPLLTTQMKTDDDLPYTCELHLINTDQTAPEITNLGKEEILSITERHKERSTSFNNFATLQDKQNKIHIFICFSAEKNNWKKKLYNFLETANDCIKFPVLFSIKLEDVLQSLKLAQAAVREFLQVFLQFACNSYLHRFRIYINDIKQKKNIDKILDLIIDKNQRRTARVSPTRGTPIYSVWRTAQGSLPKPNTNDPPYPETKDKTAFIQAAMYEQKELWKSKETNILYELGKIYKQYNINHIENKEKMQDICGKIKDKYGLINLKTGELISKQNSERQYHFGFDGVRLVELTKNRENKYCIAQNNITTNNFLLVSDDTQILNDLRLYNSIKQIDISKTSDMNLNLVQGVPGCGKTTFILNSYKTGDLILFPTKDSAIDFRKRFSSRYQTVTKNICNDTFRTLHSFLINSTQYLQQGNSYNRLIVDEALMMHAGEILFAAVVSGVREVMLIGDKNQIPFINRSQALEVKYHNISEIAPVSKVLSTTFRCTTSATAVLSKLYEQGMRTTNNTVNELKLHDFEGLSNLNEIINKTKHVCLVFKQSEKRELIKLGYNTSTVHEFQGRQAENIALIRTSTIKEDIYDSKPHCIVALSRHTKSFIYITPSRNDTLSRWIQKVNTQTIEELRDFQIENPNETSQNYLENKTSKIAQQFLGPAQQHKHHFLAQRHQPKARHKSKTLLFPRTFWNSTFRKIKLLVENTKSRLHTKM